MNIEYKGTTYTEEVLAGMSEEELLELRNNVAKDLGVAEIKGFKDLETARAQTWKALVRFSESSEDKAEEKKKSKPKARKPKKERGLAKSAMAKVVKRPTRRMFSVIKKIGEHDGSQGRAHRWPNYKDGMTIVEIIETEGTEPWDVYNWAKHGIIDVIEPTDEEYAERRAAWYAAKGMEDPEVVKARKAKERAEAKAKKEAEAKAD